MKKCSKCGKEYPDNIKFCSECGGQVVSVQQVQTYKLHCKSCNGTLTIDDDSPVLSCPFCGSKELIAESDAVTVERIKQKTHRDIEMGKQQLERERMQHDDKVAEEQKKANEIRKFRKSFMGVMLIIVTVLSVLFCAVSFNDGRILSGILAIIMGVLCVSSYLMGIQVIKEKFKGMRIITAIIAFVLIIPYFSLYNGAAPSYEDKPEDDEPTNSETTNSPTEKPTELTTEPQALNIDGFVNGYEKAEYTKFDSSEEGTKYEGTKIYVQGKLTSTEKLVADDTESILGYIKDNEGNEWLVQMHVIPVVNENHFDILINNDVVITGVYEGYSGKKNMPFIVLNEIMDIESGAVMNGMQKLLEE